MSVSINAQLKPQLGPYSIIALPLFRPR